MARARIEIPTAEMNAVLARFRRAAPEAADRAMGAGLEVLVGEAQVEAPVRTGLLKERHFVRRVRAGEYMVGASTEYALAVHETHPTKRRWFVNAVTRNFRRVMEGALRMELRRVRGGGA
jgi:hypothetical protein